MKCGSVYKTEASALVGLFDGESVENPARDYLAEIARRAKIEFFCQPGIWPGAPHTRSASTLAHPRSDKALAFLATATQEAPSFSHWGINE